LANWGFVTPEGIASVSRSSNGAWLRGDVIQVADNLELAAMRGAEKLESKSS
jgi:hypothetical protein